MEQVNPPGPPSPPKCRHGKVFNLHRQCSECQKEDHEIHKLTNPLIYEYWDSKGNIDLYHIVFRAYHMGMRNEHKTGQ